MCASVVSYTAFIFLISPTFDASKGLSFEIVAFPGVLYFDIQLSDVGFNTALSLRCSKVVG